MGASTVTGKGMGAAHNLKGPGNNRNYFVPQVNPHVVAAGEVALVGGSLTVTFPNALAGGEARYVVVLTSTTANAAYVSAKTDNGDGNFASFEITGTGTDTIGWAVLKTGWGLEA